VGYGEGCTLTSQLEGLGKSCELPSGLKTHFSDFEGYKTLLFAPICCCFEYIWGWGKAEVWVDN